MQDNKHNNKRAVPAPNRRDSGIKRDFTKTKKDKKIVQPVFEMRLGSADETAHIPPLADGDIRIIHLGGVEEIGRNMSIVEYKDSIIIVDCGIQFNEAHTPGVDFILPNTKYLEERKHKIKGMLITHGHLDHIGAIPYIMPRIGNPTIYARNFTQLMIRKRHEEFPYLDPLKINIIEKGDRVTLGDLSVVFFGVSHAIPDSMGIIIETPHGDIVHTGDLRLDHKDNIPSEREEKSFGIFKDRKVLLLMTDSTNCDNPGFSISDSIVFNNIEAAIRDTAGRLIISTFSSQVERMLFMLECAEKYGKKVVVEGRSMKTNVEVTRLAELMKIKPETIIPIETIDNYPPDKLILLVTGAQGENFAALGRIGLKNHKYIKLTKYDTILMSSSIVPGNERAVQRLKDNLSRQGAHLVHYKTSDIHSSGHANRDELAWIHSKIKPKFFIPVHGYHYLHTVHAGIAMNVNNMPKENVMIVDNGTIVEIQNNGSKIVSLKETAPKDLLVVDGTSVGKIADVIIKDRQNLGEEGVFAIIVLIDTHARRLRKSPDIASRGFIYLKESQDLLFAVREEIKNICEKYLQENQNINNDDLRAILKNKVQEMLTEATAKRPVIMPIIITN
jgi:ribonuclease J